MSSSNLRRSNLISSMVFLLGSALWTVSYFLLENPGSDWVYPAFTWVALSCLLEHSILELGTDCRFTRTVIHGRYGNQPTINMMQSVLFGIAALMEGMYVYLALFVTVDDESNEDEDESSGLNNFQISQIINLTAANIWFLTAILTFVGRGCFVGGGGLDNFGNIFYMIGACLQLASGYEQYFNPAEFLGYFAKWAAAIMWTLAGTLYCIRDSLNLKSRRRSKNAKVDNADEPLYKPREGEEP